MLGAIERATRQKLEPMQLPSVEAVNEQRVAKFLGKIGAALESADLSVFRELVERYEREHNVPAVEIAAALAQLVQGKTPLLLQAPPERPKFQREERGPRTAHDHGSHDRGAQERAPRHGERQFTPPRHTGGPAAPANAGESLFDEDRPVPRPRRDAPEVGMETFRIEVGHSHGVQPGNIVGAIANEADLESRYIGRIDIRDDYTLVDLPEGMPRELLEHLKKVRVAGRPLRMQRAEAADTDASHGRGQRPHAGPRGPHGGKPHPGGPRKPGGFAKRDKPRG
jgi:ATP-dependent RNA helicase DeaD